MGTNIRDPQDLRRDDASPAAWRAICDARKSFLRATYAAMRAILRRTTIGVILSVCLHSTAHADILSLAWDASTDSSVIGYRVSYGPASGNYTATVDVGNRTTYSLRGLADGQRYYFVV